MKKADWWSKLTEEERQIVRRSGWKDLSPELKAKVVEFWRQDDMAKRKSA